MIKLSPKEIKKIELDILKYFHNFCEENNLTYFLAYGTLLGAVRHKGFIPWDDDIDIFMPRNDYEKFFKKFYKKNKNKNIEIISIYNNQKFYVPIIKLINKNTFLDEKCNKYQFPIGIWIDIFPLDNMSSDLEKSLSLHRTVRFYNFFRYHKIWNFKFLKNEKIIENIKICTHKLIQVLIYFVSLKYLILKIDDISKKYKKEDNSKYIGYVASYDNSFLLERDWFKERVLLDFEGYKFWAPKEWDKVLKNNYGDYMKIPPENKRKGHLIEAYWK